MKEGNKNKLERDPSLTMEYPGESGGTSFQV